MNQTRIFLRGYKIMASIGVHPHEHLAKQLIKVDVELELGDTQAPQQDQLTETLNYEQLAELIENLCDQGHVQLIETLVERIATKCLADFAIQAVRVRIEKPGAIAKADAAGVELYQQA
ncbi:Dihydroneopterin aldolase [hydrothermal vent metagenome]|uniref:dihydroneopterin aldolase n=1 Tax=hydrothermal vent metagenome TaxID=652676 RepID=A0A3B0SSQ0_9ZZZZ